MREVAGLIYLHRGPSSGCGVGRPPDSREKLVLTWHPTNPPAIDPRHDETLTCWCRPLVVPIYVDTDDEGLPYP